MIADTIRPPKGKPSFVGLRDYFPWKTAGRFSLNAFIPSRASSEANTWIR